MKQSMYYTSMRDAAQAMNESKDCAVVAVAFACRVPYQVAHLALKANGRRSRDGTMFHITSAAVQDLGFKVEALENIRQKNGCRYTPKTIGEKLKRGYYLCRVANHIFAVVNGKVMDWTEGRSHRINFIYRVSKPRKAAVCHKKQE